MGDFFKPNVFFSKCLGFEACRYNGQMITDAFVEKLKPFVNIINVCPETSIGLKVPRPTIRVVSENSKLKLYEPKEGKEFTKEMIEFSESYLKDLNNIDGFLLKSGSPSCGHKNVKIYNGTAKVTGSTRGSGIFGNKIKEKFPYAAIEDEGRLHNYRIRDNFLTRIFINADFRKVKESNSLNELIHFQRRNKLLLMANSQKYTKILGRITANGENNDIKSIMAEYEKNLNLAFEKLPKYTNNINVLMHAMGYFSKYITNEETQLLLDSLEKYKMKKLTIMSPMLLVKSYVVRFNIDYLLEQTYFNPYPEDLIVLEDSEKIEI
ncbi:YbgA family protein [Clostridium beijerinckii]|uniref:YbgA family protein n=1 Tax=Clostridium beijerinckii TaxID=1520 RepID=UPI001F2EFCB6|nr:DUF523 and DUF1722 domain-containing protein [Clostridium beijerinckii]